MDKYAEFLWKSVLNVTMTDDQCQKPSNSVIDQIVSLTLRAREDETESLIQKRDRILSQYNYKARVRDEDDTLVLHPVDWINDNGNVNPSDINNMDRAVEVPLSGSRNDADWQEVEKVNSNIVSDIQDEYGDIHASNARSFADFMGNHHLKRITKATQREKDEFLNYYFPRNVWSTDEQERLIEETLDLIGNF